MASMEPATKKAKTEEAPAAAVEETPAIEGDDVVEHSMNINAAVDKAYEGKNFTELCEAPISALQGIAEWTDDLVSGFPRPVPLTIGKLGKWKYFLWARAITVLAEKEIEGKREKGISININKGLDVAHEHKSLKEICALPPSALQGIAERSDPDFASIRIHTIGDLGKWKFAHWAAAIVSMAELEHVDVSAHK
eukprot:CAMPEP_0185797104 /NCGR_PEP_ID=MMETSP1174-20130828/161439_1 /TAXON_ID=35687 /ORGANISM="Dictyocha speculum, Strain CCMP1381" /LENGTH=193 /DNA_ID=CAMNT_0028492519 /DNA_START=1516 /DNA_END=2097 /DNA_ORIENTATION=-